MTRPLRQEASPAQTLGWNLQLVAAVLAMDHDGSPGEVGGGEGVEARQPIVRMEDIDPLALKKLGQARHHPKILARPPVELEARDTAMENLPRPVSLEADAADARLKQGGVQPVADLDHPVFHDRPWP